MAIITQIDVISKEPGTHRPRPCTACYEVGQYLQLDTYASEAGMAAASVKQSIHLEREGAAQLLELIRQAFPDLFAGPPPGEKSAAAS